MDTQSPKITVIGSTNTDMVVKTQHFPVPGQTILGGEFFMFSGGKGANQAVAAARMGANVYFIANTGNDIFGQRAITLLKAENINTDYVFTDAVKPSGVALILVDGKGENEIVVAPGANDSLTDQHILSAEPAIRDTDLLLLQLEIPVSTVMIAARMAAGLNKKVILNPAPAQDLPQDIYPLLYLVTPNETEAEILTGVNVKDEDSAKEAASILLNRGVQNVIITLGSKGAYFKNQQTEFIIKAPIVKAVDTTAAGDVFNGVLALEIAAKKDWAAAINLACAAASLSVTRMGAQASMPFRNEVPTHPV